MSCTLPLDGHTAIVGGPGRDEFAMLVARLRMPTGGRIRVGDQDLSQLPEAVTGRRIAYVGQTSYMFTASLRDNLYYGLRHRPLTPRRNWTSAVRRNGSAAPMRPGRPATPTSRSTRTGSTMWRPAAMDRNRCGGAHGRARHGRSVGRRLRPWAERDAEPPELRRCDRAHTGGARRRFGRSWLSRRCARWWRSWNPERYNNNATVAENLLFGSPVGPVFAIDSMAENTYVLEVLEKVGLTGDFLDMGVQVARTMIELFADLPPGHQFFEQFSFISSDDLPDFQPMVAKADKDGVDSLKPEEKRRLMALPFKLIPARHRLGLMNADLERRLLEARQVFARDLPMLCVAVSSSSWRMRTMPLRRSRIIFYSKRSPMVRLRSAARSDG